MHVCEREIKREERTLNQEIKGKLVILAAGTTLEME